MLVRESERFGNPVLVRPRLGQGTFRVASVVAVVTAFSASTPAGAVAFRSHARTGTARAASVGA